MFVIAKILGGRQNVAETLELPVTAGKTYTVGQALTVASGALTAASGAVEAKYIAAESYTAPSSGARKLRCYRITPDMLFEVGISAYSASTQKVGAKLQFSTDGSLVTATAAETGGAEIVDLNGAAKAGDKILVFLA